MQGIVKFKYQKKCQYPQCGKTFSCTSESRMYCDEHSNAEYHKEYYKKVKNATN